MPAASDHIIVTTNGKMKYSGKILKLAVAALSLATSATCATASKVTLIDASGSLNKAIPSISNSGIVALLTSPGTPSWFDEEPVSQVQLSDEGDSVVLTSPGASLEPSSLLTRGAGAAAAGSVANSVVLSGVTLADVERGLGSTRHGRTLNELFAAVIRMDQQRPAGRLVVAVQAPEGTEAAVVDDEQLKRDVEQIFQSVAAAAWVDDSLEDYFVLEVVVVRSKQEASAVMKKAVSAASNPMASDTSFSTLFCGIYNDIVGSESCDPTPVAEAILACNDAYSRASRMSRSKIAMWKHRTSRGLLVDNFGPRADSLIKNALDLFDRDTMAAAGLPRAGEKRLEIRSQLRERTEKMIRELHAVQMALLEKSTLKKFNKALLRKLGADDRSEKFYENNAAVLQNALFAFEKTASTLQVTSLALAKSKYVQSMSEKLNNLLVGFTDSPAAKIKAMKGVAQTVSKKKKPTEGSVDIALDFVAMIRPDGFGNLQGFAGYQFGPHSVTVGLHNDADDPQVISSFGGVRPPFIRVQPKLKLDIEL